jgi:hypothetical protein
LSQPQGISQELSWGEVISKTFELYRSNLLNYVILFAVIEGVIGVLSYVAQLYIGPLPVVPISPTPQQALTYLGAVLSYTAELLLVSAVLSVGLLPVAEGPTVRMASDEIQKGETNLGASLSSAISRLLSMWVLYLVLGLIVGLGLVALIVPGIILAIMFSLCLPVLLLENKGVLDSMSRSRQLVGQRWLKTFVIFGLLILITVVAGAVVGVITGPLAPANGILNSIISALWAPLLPIGVTVYYYSNVARTSSPQMGPTMMAAAGVPQAGMKFCPSCGTQMRSSAVFCPKCGTRQPP